MGVHQQLANAAGKSGTNARRPVGRVTERILRKVWSLRLARAEFRDLENPENPDAPLSSAGAPSHLHDRELIYSFDRSKFAAGRSGPEEFDDATMRLSKAYRASVVIGVETTAEYYRRVEHLAWRFDDATERAIAVALSDGHGVRRIKAELHIGQRRVERVMKQIRIWMAEPTTTGDDGDD